MNEFELIDRLKPLLPRNDSVVVGVGDDCAVLMPPAAGQQLLFKTDAVVEGVHFTAETPGEKVGRKALARAVSDIAAMGVQLYFWGRVAFLPLYAIGVPFLRTIAWTAASAGIAMVLLGALPGI